MGFFIREVEAIVGLSKKNIRYYEEVGLIKPARDGNNDYRVYSEDDVRTLKVVKFLRELGVPIREIKLLSEGKIALSDCMSDRISKIEGEEEKFVKIKNMCQEIKMASEDFNSIDINKYFLEINLLNKEGFTMRDVRTNKGKKIRGAVLSSIIFGLFFCSLIFIISYFQFTEVDIMPWFLYWFIVVMFLFPICGIFYNLIVRIKEINGGEEDEASKY